MRRTGGTVTVSASYGAGGSEIAPAVANALGLPFFDRAIPASVARKMEVPLREAVQQDETVDTGLVGVIASMALVPDLSGPGPVAYQRFPDTRTFRVKTEEVLHEIANGIGGVILGRAAALVLASTPRALHVRLDGPEEARVEAVVRRAGLDPAAVRDTLRANDAARSAYVRHFYRSDPASARHYHLVVDTSAIAWDVVTDLIVVAARSRGIGTESAGAAPLGQGQQRPDWQYPDHSRPERQEDRS